MKTYTPTFILAAGLIFAGCEKPASIILTAGDSRSATPQTFERSNSLAKRFRTRRIAQQRLEASGDASFSDTGHASPTLRERLSQARSESDPNLRAAAFESVAWDAVETDAAVFDEAFAELAADSPERRRLLAHEGSRLAEEEPESALSLAYELAADSEYAEFSGAIAVALAEKNPQSSAALVASLSDETVKHRCAVQVLQRWSGSDPSAAAAWVAGFPEGAARTDGLSVVIQSWLTNDPPGLAAWLKTQAAIQMQGESLSALSTIVAQQPEPTRIASLIRFPQIKLP